MINSWEHILFALFDKAIGVAPSAEFVFSGEASIQV